MPAPSPARRRPWPYWTSASAWDPNSRERVFYRNRRTRELGIFGATENFSRVEFLDLAMGRFFSEGELQRRRNVAVLGQTPYLTLFGDHGMDPIGKKVRVGADEFTVIGVVKKRPSPAGSTSAPTISW